MNLTEFLKSSCEKCPRGEYHRVLWEHITKGVCGSHDVHGGPEGSLTGQMA